jgi:hypothetical protein
MVSLLADEMVTRAGYGDEDGIFLNLDGGLCPQSTEFFFFSGKLLLGSIRKGTTQ